MTPYAESGPRLQIGSDPEVLLVLMPGMGMHGGDFHARGVVAAVEQRRWPVAISTVDPGADAYLDGSLETRVLDGIAEARRKSGARRVWLAGISLACQAILRSVRVQPDVAEGVILLTPYLAATGLIAEVSRAGGLRNWAKSNLGRGEPDRALLTWLATTPPAGLPSLLVGSALGDRFATTAAMLLDLIPAARVVTVPGRHDWESWFPLWRLMLDQDPFRLEQHPPDCNSSADKVARQNNALERADFSRQPESALAAALVPWCAGGSSALVFLFAAWRGARRCPFRHRRRETMKPRTPQCTPITWNSVPCRKSRRSLATGRI